MVGKFCYHLIEILISSKFRMQIYGFLFQKISQKAFYRKFKTKKNRHDLASPVSGLKCNRKCICFAIKLKLHIETDVIETRAELVNAECGMWRSLSIEYIQNLYASIPHKLHSTISEKYFLQSTEHLRQY